MEKSVEKKENEMLNLIPTKKNNEEQHPIRTAGMGMQEDLMHAIENLSKESDGKGNPAQIAENIGRVLKGLKA